MKKAVKIGIGVGVVGVTGLSIFAILKQRKLAKQAFDAAEFDEAETVDEAVEEAGVEEHDSDDEADAHAAEFDEAETVDEAVEEAGVEEHDSDDEADAHDAEDDEEELSSEEEQEAVEEKQDSDEITGIYPPIDQCPYKSREVWAARIDDCISLLYNQIMKTTKKINWEKIENEVIDKYLEASQDEFGVTGSGYEERYIRSKIMKINREHYENVIDTIDSVIDDIFNTNIDNKYIVDGHVNNKMILNDVMLKCCEDGVIREWQWPSVCAHLENNVNTTCEYIEACMAKRRPQ